MRWSLQELADRAGLHRNTVHNFEAGHFTTGPSNVAMIEFAFIGAGVSFQEDAERGNGVFIPARRR